MTDLRPTLTGDLHKAASKVKDELPSRGVNAEQSAKQFGHEVGAKIDSAVRFHQPFILLCPRF